MKHKHTMLSHMDQQQLAEYWGISRSTPPVSLPEAEWHTIDAEVRGDLLSLRIPPALRDILPSYCDSMPFVVV